MSGKVLHRITAVGACALIAAGSCATAFAFGKSYYLPEVSEMTISIPGELNAITRDAKEGDSYFTTFRQDYAATMKDFETNHIYLQGMDSNASLTVTVTMTETAESQSFGNYNLLATEKLSEIAKSFLSDSSYTACRVDTSGRDISWIQFDTNINNGKGLLANTVVDGKSVNVSMHRNGGDVTAEDTAAFKEMVSGVRFGNRNFFEQYGMMILVAIAAILVVAVITMIIIRVVRSRREERPSAQDENEKILEELAGKYSRKQRVTHLGGANAAEQSEKTVPEADPEAEAEEQPENERETAAKEEEAPPVIAEPEILGAEDIEEFADEEDEPEAEPVEAEQAEPAPAEE